MSAPATITPKALAEALKVDPKALRTYLRRTSPRPAEAKNTTWAIDEATAKGAREHFAAKAPKA